MRCARRAYPSRSVPSGRVTTHHRSSVGPMFHRQSDQIGARRSRRSLEVARRVREQHAARVSPVRDSSRTRMDIRGCLTASRALCASASDAHARGARVGRARARVGRLERAVLVHGRRERDVVLGAEPVLPRARADCQSARRPRGRARARAAAPSPVLPLEMGLYLGLFPLATKPRNPPHVSSESDMSSESHASSDDS